jgi:signal transduction histidine kinase
VNQQLRPPLTARLRQGHWVALDGVLAGLYAAVLVAGASGGPPTVQPRGVSDDVGHALALATVLAVAARRRWPLAVMAAVQAGACATAVLGVGLTGFLPAAYALYLVPLRLPGRRAGAVLAAVLATTYAAVALAPPPWGRGGLGAAAGRALPFLAIQAAAWAVGFAVRQQRAYAAGLRDQAEQRARARVAEERLRIARELHDVVAHSMSLIAVQAAVANYVVSEHPEEAARVLSSIEETSRAALGETRRLLGLLRDEDGARLAPELAPAPGLGDLEKLVARTAEAGVRVDLEVRGRRRDAPAGVGLAAYRIVQEALTNVVKHAGAAGARVVVAYEDDALAIEVTDDGRGGLPGPPGHGIVGMRERVGLYGGDLDAGPLPGGGFRVAARLPWEAAG